MTKHCLLIVFVFFTSCFNKSSQKTFNLTKVNFYLENMCTSHMNKMYKVNAWNCSMRNNLSVDKKMLKILEPKNRNNPINCLCSISYECYDFEEFVLESDLINISMYMSKESYLYKNYYTQQCELGLEQLTNETKWRCALQYDRLSNDEYYCDCKRSTICRMEKFLTL
jgi:hypothetical protein